MLRGICYPFVGLAYHRGAIRGRHLAFPCGIALGTDMGDIVLFSGNVMALEASLGKLLESQSTRIAQHHIVCPAVPPVRRDRDAARGAPAALCRSVRGDSSA